MKIDQALAKLIPHLYQSSSIQEYVDTDDIGERICGLFEQIIVVIEDKVELTGFHDAEPREML